VLRTTSLRVLDERDLPGVLAVLERDPVSNVFVASRIEAVGLDPWRLGGELWGHVVDGRIEALCYAGANLVLVDAGPEAVASFAERARRRGRRCSSLVGPADMTKTLWDLLEPHWGPARDVRPEQPLMAISGPPLVEPDPLVRRVAPHELDVVLPACVAMFTEEVGVSPLDSDGGTLYRSRVNELISQGRSFARIEDGQVVFKAEVGAVAPGACQVQGVWVHPDRRGEALSAPGMAAVVRAALSDMAPVVSLYVNGFNTAARASYARVGFRDVGTFMSVLF
jgi:predicted GNAT family acetyltransferase